jgi:hypothetical protein
MHGAFLLSKDQVKRISYPHSLGQPRDPCAVEIRHLVRDSRFALRVVGLQSVQAGIQRSDLLSHPLADVFASVRR